MLAVIDRQKRKNEELASQLLGKNRKTGAGTKKKAQNAPAGSLASRIGVTKVITRMFIIAKGKCHFSNRQMCSAMARHLRSRKVRTSLPSLRHLRRVLKGHAREMRIDVDPMKNG